MIVVTMTPEEIHKEIIKDFPTIYRRGSAEGKILQTQLRRQRLKQQVRSIKL